MKIFKKERLPNGRRHIYFCGIKVFSYRHKRNHIHKQGENNYVRVDGHNLQVLCSIFGNNNSVIIEESCRGGHINIHIRGNNNTIYIKKSAELQNLNINIGNYMEISNSEVFIDSGACIVNVEVLIEQHHCKLHIGKHCLMSKDILFRLGEIPHLVFDSKTKEYVDTPHDLIIGDHVWIGAGATLIKKTRIGNDCIVGARAVVTKDFNENNVMIAGNPAQIKRRNVYWVGSYGSFQEKEQEYKENYERYIKQFGEPSNIK